MQESACSLQARRPDDAVAHTVSREGKTHLRDELCAMRNGYAWPSLFADQVRKNFCLSSTGAEDRANVSLTGLALFSNCVFEIFLILSIRHVDCFSLGSEQPVRPASSKAHSSR